MPGAHPTRPDASEPGGVELAPGVRLSEGLLRWQFSRSGGPGGQNVNKVSTKAELRIALDDLPLSPRVKTRLCDLAGRRITGVETFTDEFGNTCHVGGEIILTSESERSQSGNKSECLARLRALLIEAQHIPKVRRKTRPTRASKERRVESKKRRAEVKRNRSRPD